MILVTKDKKVLTNSAGEILTGDRCPYQWYRLTVSFETGDINPGFVPGSSSGVWQIGAISGFSLDRGRIIYYRGNAVWEYGYWGSYPTALDVRTGWLATDETTPLPGRTGGAESVVFCVSRDASGVNPGIVYRIVNNEGDVAVNGYPPAALTAIYPDFYATYNLEYLN